MNICTATDKLCLKEETPYDRICSILYSDIVECIYVSYIGMVVC